MFWCFPGATKCLSLGLGKEITYHQLLRRGTVTWFPVTLPEHYFLRDRSAVYSLINKYFTDLRNKNKRLPSSFHVWGWEGGAQGVKTEGEEKLALGPNSLACLGVRTGWGPHLWEGEMALTVALRLRQVEDLVHVGFPKRPAEGGEEEAGY